MPNFNAYSFLLRICAHALGTGSSHDAFQSDIFETVHKIFIEQQIFRMVRGEKRKKKEESGTITQEELRKKVAKLSKFIGLGKEK